MPREGFVPVLVAQKRSVLVNPNGVGRGRREEDSHLPDILMPKLAPDVGDRVAI
jgi:hypothetical protein